MMKEQDEESHGYILAMICYIVRGGAPVERLVRARDKSLGRIPSGCQDSGLAYFCRIIITESLLNIALPTPLNPFYIPSPEPLASKEAITRRKCKFFDTLATYRRSRSLRSISKQCGISSSCGDKWKEQWDSMGSEAKRKTRTKS